MRRAAIVQFFVETTDYRGKRRFFFPIVMCIDPNEQEVHYVRSKNSDVGSVVLGEGFHQDDQHEGGKRAPLSIPTRLRLPGEQG
ncbi:MAG TPA: hypothetical protein VKP69_08855 [Isosphaeraceae bacterium]|nr:hypothetical protein [Isosphaeraceae bacterium]